MPPHPAAAETAADTDAIGPIASGWVKGIQNHENAKDECNKHCQVGVFGDEKGPGAALDLVADAVHDIIAAGSRFQLVVVVCVK
jgi:hypothetical protein